MSESLLDRAGKVREGEEIDPVAVGRYLRKVVPELEGTPQIRQYPKGASNLTYEIAFEDRRFVLRRPPIGTKAKSAHDMNREYSIQRALKPVYPYVPEMIAFCDDPSVVGAEFYVMEKLEGIIPRATLSPGLEIGPDSAAELCRNVIDRLIELHRIDYESAGLAEIGKGEGYVRRQIEGWSKRYRNARTENVPDFEDVMQWLAENIRDDVATCVIHNDFRFDNVVLDPDDPTRVIGVLDWEMATLGDPLMDLGNSLAYWIEAEDPPQLAPLRLQPTDLPGMMTRDEVVSYYCDAMDVEGVDFGFYRIYGLFRLAVIIQQIYYRYHHGQTKNEAFAEFHLMVGILDRHCREQMRKGQR